MVVVVVGFVVVVVYPKGLMEKDVSVSRMDVSGKVYTILLLNVTLVVVYKSF